MHSLIPHIEVWFAAKKEHTRILAAVDTRVEGWFKGEMLVLLTHLVDAGLVSAFKRENNMKSPKDGSRKQIDIRIDVKGVDYYCELKALCISKAAGTPRDLGFYFHDDGVGLLKDFKKLDELNITNKWVLGFVYPSPDIVTWTAAVQSLPSTLSHWSPITSPPKTPKSLFISIWKAK